VNPLRKLARLALQCAAKCSVLLYRREVYVRLVQWSHRVVGVRFDGKPRYIHLSAMLDPSGGLVIGDRAVISADVTILTHDYALTAGLRAAGQAPETDVAVRSPVTIGRDCFIGARAIILPGSNLGNNVIIGAGAVVRGTIPDDSIAVGVPARVVGRASEWAVAKLASTPRHELYHDSR